MKRLAAFIPVVLMSLAAAVAWAQPAQRTRVVFHVDSPNPPHLAVALRNARSVERLEGKGNVRIVIVADGPAVRYFVRGHAGKFAAQMEELKSTGDVEFHVCETSLKAFGYGKSEILPGCVIVPAGVLDIVNLEKEGYTYIKP